MQKTSKLPSGVRKGQMTWLVTSVCVCLSGVRPLKCFIVQNLHMQLWVNTTQLQAFSYERQLKFQMYITVKQRDYTCMLSQIISCSNVLVYIMYKFALWQKVENRQTAE